MTDKHKPTNQTFEERIGLEIKNDEKPIVKNDELGCLTFVWANYELIVDAGHFKDESQAELTFWHDSAEHTKLLLQTRVNLLSISNTESLARRLRNCDDGLRYLPWDWILTCITHGVVNTVRQGEKIEKIWPSKGDDLKPDYLLEPLLYLNHPSIIFGDYGSFKSYMALIIGYIVQLPLIDNKLGLIPIKEATRCLILDYEDDSLNFTRRWSAIQEGFGIEVIMPIFYKRMTNSLTESVESLQSIIAKEKIGLLIIDSLGPAARGNLNDSEPAIKYHEALRRLGITSLTLAHCSKDQLTKKRTIFGSVFFTNLTRSAWECKAEHEAGEDEAIISLKHTKANLSKLHLPLGYKFTFTDDKVVIAKTDLRDTGLSGELTLPTRIKDLLRGGAMPARQIAESLDANEMSVRTILNRMTNKRGILVKVGETWGLKQEA